MKIKNKLGFLLWSVALLFAQTGQGLVRIMPGDYGTVEHLRVFKHPKDLVNLAHPITARLDGIRDFHSPADFFHKENIGGKADLVYQEDEQQVTHIYSCPTIRYCLHEKNQTDVTPPSSSSFAALVETTTKADSPPISYDQTGPVAQRLNSCVSDPQYWQCKELVQAPKDLMCTHFVKAYRFLLFKSWLITNVVGTIVEWPIKWLQVGIQYIINTAGGVVNAGITVSDIIHARCSSASMDLALNPQVQLNKKTIFIFKEEKQENVSLAIAAFSRKSKSKKDDQLTDEQKMQSGGYFQAGALNVMDLMDVKNITGFVPFEKTGDVQEIKKPRVVPEQQSDTGLGTIN